jgi:hypothetical protein
MHVIIADTNSNQTAFTYDAVHVFCPRSLTTIAE